MLTKLGQFEVLEVIGRGGMGTVYRGIDPIIGRAVAVKVIRMLGYKDSQEQSWLKERLFREARAAGRLNHAGIVTIYQVGEEQDVAYIAMEFVDGENLQEILAREDVDKNTLCKVILETGAALDYAHKRGLVHRDIKPANLMVTAAGVTKVTDFGIAKTMLGQTATKTGMILGTPFYMSPEQILGKPLDGRSDQFALAVIAYEIFTGRKPFQADQITSVCYQILHEEPLSPEDVNPRVGHEVGAVIKRGLAKEAEDRYPSCSEFAEALDAAVKATDSKSRAQQPAPGAGTLEPLRPSPPLPGSAGTISVRVWLIPALVTAVAAASLITAMWKPGGAVAQQNLPSVSRTVSEPPPVVIPEAPPPVAPESHVTRPIPAPIRQNPLPSRIPTPAHQEAAPPVQRNVPASITPTAVPPVVQEPALRTGAIVWTGRLRAGEFLTIDNGRATSGAMAGVLPRTPVRIHVYPAQMMNAVLTAYTPDPRYLTPLKVVTRSGEAILTFDPRHATDLVVFEQPGPQNGWARLSIRINANLTACVIEWQAQ